MHKKLHLSFTSIFALVQRGISTTILYTFCVPFAWSGMSCNGEIALPFSLAANQKQKKNIINFMRFQCTI